MRGVRTGLRASDGWRCLVHIDALLRNEKNIGGGGAKKNQGKFSRINQKLFPPSCGDCKARLSPTIRFHSELAILDLVKLSKDLQHD